MNFRHIRVKTPKNKALSLDVPQTCPIDIGSKRVRKTGNMTGRGVMFSAFLVGYLPCSSCIRSLFAVDVQQWCVSACAHRPAP
jgi:hypothetical protein